MDSVEDSSASAEQPADSPQSEGSELLRCPKCDKTFAGDSGSTCSECGGELVPDTDSGPKKALLVDDSPLDQVKFEELLQGLGFDVTIASNGQEAISLLDEIQPDLIVMDVVMPGRGGFRSCRRSGRAIKKSIALCPLSCSQARTNRAW